MMVEEGRGRYSLPVLEVRAPALWRWDSSMGLPGHLSSGTYTSNRFQELFLRARFWRKKMRKMQVQDGPPTQGRGRLRGGIISDQEEEKDNQPALVSTQRPEGV